MKKLISAVLILTLIFSLGISSFSVSAKMVYTGKGTPVAISTFDFNTHDADNNIDYSVYNGVNTSKGTAGGTVGYASSGASIYGNSDKTLDYASWRKNSGSGGSGNDISKLALKLHNVIDSKKFEAGKTYKIGMKMKLEGVVMVQDTGAATNRYKYISLYSGTTPINKAQAFAGTGLGGENLIAPSFYVLKSASDWSAATVSGTKLQTDSKKLSNYEWVDVELPAFTATNDMATTAAGTGSYSGSNLLQYSSLRFDIKPTPTTVDGKSYSLIPEAVLIDDITIYEMQAETADDPNYIKVYDGSSKAEISQCGDGGVAPELITDFGWNDSTSIKETLKDGTQQNAGIRVQKIFGDIPPNNDDIGKTFEISAYIYPERQADTPEDSEGTFVEMALSSAYAATNAWNNRYKAIQYFVPWNEWSKITVYHRVTEDTSTDYDIGDGKNYILDALRIQGSTFGSKTIANTVPIKAFYVDNIVVKEVTDVPEEAAAPEISQVMFPAANGSKDAMFSEITITPSSTVNIGYICTYMIPGASSTATVDKNGYFSGLADDFAIADKKIVSVPKIIGGDDAGTITVFSVITGIPEDKADTEIASKVAYTLTGPYIYLSGWNTNNISSASGSVNGLLAPAGE